MIIFQGIIPYILLLFIAETEYILSKCTYCNTLSKAIEGQNYCSNNGDAVETVSTNAYYFKTMDLRSGNHVSRFSLRTISDGYQQHSVDKSSYVLDKDHCLMINQGESFTSSIKANGPVEGLLVAYNEYDFQSGIASAIKSNLALLDNPFEQSISDYLLNTRCLQITTKLRSQFRNLRSCIINEVNDAFYYEEAFGYLLKEIIDNCSEIDVKFKNSKIVKASTRKELYSRLMRVKLYIDNSFSDQISLSALSNLSTMSPFHFLKMFKVFFGQSPHQYLMERRIDRVKFLLRDRDETIISLARSVGFQNHSSFSRLFKRRVGISPLDYRNKYHKIYYVYS